jgi:diadenosine tetraphosphate (Ap4A) HIT family hydrolase
VFTRIMRGDLPATHLVRDETCVAILSINPISPGHALVIPRAEVDQWLDLPEATRDHLFRVAHAVGLAQREVFGCARAGLAIAGFEVPHTHLHVIPMFSMDEMRFERAAPARTQAQLETAARPQRAVLRRTGLPGVVDDPH